MLPSYFIVQSAQLLAIITPEFESDKVKRWKFDIKISPGSALGTFHCDAPFNAKQFVRLNEQLAKAVSRLSRDTAVLAGPLALQVKQFFINLRRFSGSVSDNLV